MNERQSYFYCLAKDLQTQLKHNEFFLAYYQGEESSFVRFNHALIRQASDVLQATLLISLISGKKHATYELVLSFDYQTDAKRIKQAVSSCRSKISYLPDDPYLLFATEIHSTESFTSSPPLPDPHNLVDQIMQAASGLDLVGIYAHGDVDVGFANSIGQRNWFSRPSFNFDWSLHNHSDKAVKASYSGFEWCPHTLKEKVGDASQQLTLLQRKPITISPGHYPAFLAPAAVCELTQSLCWEGFSSKAIYTKQSPLLRLYEESSPLSPSISLTENIEKGFGPSFGPTGFVKQKAIPLVSKGQPIQALVSPGSAQEFGLSTDGSDATEIPTALDMAPGDLSSDAVLSTLDTGIWISNLWYLNFSDRNACRITGMTRFATFWVEHGEIQAPLNVMRFDDSAYRMLGSELRAITQDKEIMLDSDTYERRSTRSFHLPGILLNSLRLTL